MRRVALSCCFLASMTMAVAADPFKEVGEFATSAISSRFDPIGLVRGTDELSSTADRLIQFGLEFEDRVNENLKDRISQLGEEARATIQEAERAVARQIDVLNSDLKAQVDEILSKINSLERRLIRDLVCVGGSVSEFARRAIVDVLEQINGLTLDGGVLIGDLELVISGLDNQTPIERFRTFENQTLERVNLSSSGASSQLIMETYGELARVARMTSCLYDGMAIQRELLIDYAKYEKASSQWYWIRRQN